MEAKELRIGNFTYKMLQSGNGRIIVSNITSTDLLRIEEERIFYYEPIPITEEWLLKFGFQKTEYDYKIQIQKDNKGGNTDYWIYVDSGIDNQTNKFIIQILSKENCWFTSKNEYVHQLQNLYFSLTGEELIIK